LWEKSPFGARLGFMICVQRVVRVLVIIYNNYPVDVNCKSDANFAKLL